MPTERRRNPKRLVLVLLAILAPMAAHASSFETPKLWKGMTLYQARGAIRDAGWLVPGQPWCTLPETADAQASDPPCAIAPSYAKKLLARLPEAEGIVKGHPLIELCYGDGTGDRVMATFSFSEKAKVMKQIAGLRLVHWHVENKGCERL